jgi:hypothetical protein
MRVTVQRSGGFAGLVSKGQTQSVDTERLGAAARDAVEGAVTGAAFFTLPEKAAPTDRRSDAFSYTITVDAGGRSHTVVASESLPPAVQAIVDAVRKAAAAGG